MVTARKPSKAHIFLSKMNAATQLFIQKLKAKIAQIKSKIAMKQ